MEEVESVLKLSNYKDKILTEAKNDYMDEIKFIGADKEPNIFSWKNENLKWYIFQVHNHSIPSEFRVLIFAVKNDVDKDELVLQDVRKMTDEFDVNDVIYNKNELFKVLISKNIISDKVSPVYGSLFFGNSFTQNIINEIIKNKMLSNSFKDFAVNEYKNINDYLKKKTYQTIKYDEKIFFANKFDFNKIIEVVNDDDFSKSLSDCMWAYNNGRWFLSASSLGSIIEQLMFLTICNYNIKSNDDNVNKVSNRMKSKLGKTPTFAKYMEAFKLDPINMNDKQERYIRSTFDLRNCVNHYTSGYTNKSMVDNLLLLVTNIYSDFFVKSIEYKKNNI